MFNIEMTADYRDFNNDQDFPLRVRKYLLASGVTNFKYLNIIKEDGVVKIVDWKYEIAQPSAAVLVSLDISDLKQKETERLCCKPVMYNTMRQRMGYVDKDGNFVDI